MSLTAGKTDIKSLTAPVEIFAPGDDGKRTKVGTFRVTTKILPRSEFVELTKSAKDDCAIARELIVNIEAGDKNTNVAPYTPELVDDIFEINWQFDPVLDFVLAANNERLGKVLKVKN